jgi:hypothetical protein
VTSRRGWEHTELLQPLSIFLSTSQDGEGPPDMEKLGRALFEATERHWIVLLFRGFGICPFPPPLLHGLPARNPRRHRGPRGHGLGFPHRATATSPLSLKVTRHDVAASRLAQAEAESSIRDLIASREVAELPI